MIDLILNAKVIDKDGQKRLVFEKPDFYYSQINQFNEGTNVEVEINRKSGKRSNQQNRYWHKVCFPAWAEILGDFNEVEAKAYCRDKFIPIKVKKAKNRQNIEIKLGTSDLSVSEGWDFTQKMIMNAAVHGHKILTPCEAGYNCGRKECLVCNAEKTEIPYPEGQEEVTAF